MTAQFNSLVTSTCSSPLAAAPVSSTLTMTDHVISIVFSSDVVANAKGDASTSNRTWLVHVVDIELASPTRRSFVLELQTALQAVQGTASVRLTTAGQTTSREVTAKDSPRELDGTLRLRIPRSTKPKTHLRVLVEVTAQTLNAAGEAMAGADVLDVRAA